jgi:hypothetical protein
MHVYEIHTHEMHACEVRAYEVHAVRYMPHDVANRPRFGCNSADMICLGLRAGCRQQGVASEASQGVASKAGRASGVYRSPFFHKKS